VTGPGSYRLQTLEGDDVNNSWNVDQLCRFYESTRLPWGLKSIRLHQDTFAVSGLRVRHQSLDYSSPGSSTCGYLRIPGCDERQRTLAAVYWETMYSYTATNGSTAVSGYTP
jgi:hypothetical protein